MLNRTEKEMKIEKDISFESFRRIGPPKKKNIIGSKTLNSRPVVVTFKDNAEKEMVKRESSKLKTPLGCSLDLPQPVKRARQSLNEDFKRFKEEKKQVAMMYPARIVDLSTRETLKEADVTMFLEKEK